MERCEFGGKRGPAYPGVGERWTESFPEENVVAQVGVTCHAAGALVLLQDPGTILYFEIKLVLGPLVAHCSPRPQSIANEGDIGTITHRVKHADKDGNFISPWHDIPLHTQGKLFNFVAEIPKG